MAFLFLEIRQFDKFITLIFYYFSVKSFCMSQPHCDNLLSRFAALINAESVNEIKNIGIFEKKVENEIIGGW